MPKCELLGCGTYGVPRAFAQVSAADLIDIRDRPSSLSTTIFLGSIFQVMAVIGGHEELVDVGVTDQQLRSPLFLAEVRPRICATRLALGLIISFLPNV
jgi:hypothetical protein